MTPRKTARLWFVLSLASLPVLSAVFLSFPGIDLWFSGVFLDAQGHFWLGAVPALQSLRRALWTIADLVALLWLGLALLALVRGPVLGWGVRVWLFAVASFVLGPGLLANAILKSYWGRARPQSVVEFGGTARFSPPVLISDQCQHNCSFVSGEASAFATVALVLGLLLLPRLPVHWRWPTGLAVALYALGGSLLRVAFGRHFLSDVVFAGALMATVTLGLYLAMGLGKRAR